MSGRWGAIAPDADFDDKKHPRGQPGNAGQFAAGGSGGGGKTKKAKAAKAGIEKTASAPKPKASTHAHRVSETLEYLSSRLSPADLDHVKSVLEPAPKKPRASKPAVEPTAAQGEYASQLKSTSERSSSRAGTPEDDERFHELIGKLRADKSITKEGMREISEQYFGYEPKKSMSREALLKRMEDMHNVGVRNELRGRNIEAHNKPWGHDPLSEAKRKSIRGIF